MISALDLLRKKAPRDWTLAIVTGEEEFLRAEAIESLVASLAPDIEARVFAPSDSGDPPALAEVLDELRSRDLFGGQSYVRIEAADAFMKAHGARLARCVKDGEAVQPLLIEAEKLLARGKKAKLSGALEELAACGALIVQCDPLYDTNFGQSAPAVDSPLSQWVAERALRYEKTLSLKNAFLLHRLIGNHLRELDAELQKLSLTIGARKEITAEDLKASIAAQRIVPIFDLVSAVCTGRLDAAFDLSEALFTRGMADAQGKVTRAPEAIAMSFLGAFTSRLKAIGRAKELIDQGSDFAAASRAVGQFGPFATNFRAELEGLSPPGVLRRITAAAAELERELKRGAGNPRLLFDRFLVQGRRVPARRRPS